jgi:uncharacterized membrane protein YdjX (TVP38/TMEM64 family)
VRGGRRIPEPSELVYVPAPSWTPALIAVGLAGVLIGLFAGWAYAMAGAVLGLGALWAWVRRTREDIGRLPREQRVSAAVLPAVPLRRTGDGS